jgi:hypothetical protein
MGTKRRIVATALMVSSACLLVWLALRPLSVVFALDSGDYYLRLLNGDSLSTTSPTATTAQFKDSPAVNRTTYQEIGVWTAAAATGAAPL